MSKILIYHQEYVRQKVLSALEEVLHNENIN